MISSGKLSRKSRATGRNVYRTFNVLNAISFSLLTDNILILFALAMGAPPYCAAILAALMYLGNAGVLIGRKNITTRGAAGNISFAWLVRSLCMIPAIIAPFAAKWIGEEMVFWTLLLPASSGFYFFRASGLVSINSLWGEICESGRGRGRFIAELWNRATLTSLAAYTVVALITRYSDRIEIYQLILFMGVTSGLVASWVVNRVPESETPRESARKPIGDSLQAIREDSSLKNFMLACAASFSALAIVAPIPLLMIKNGYGIADDQAMIFVIIQLFGSILVASINTQVMGHTGPRPLVIIYYLLLPVNCVLLYLAPEGFNWLYFGTVFLIQGIILSGVPMALSNYSLNVMPEDKRVGMSIINSVLAGAGAGLSGLIFTSGLLKLLSVLELDGLELYRWYIVCAVVMLLIFLIFIYRLHPLEDWEVKKVLGLLITPRDIRTIYTINRLDESMDTPEKEDAAIDKLSSLKSNLSLESLLTSLESPKYNVRRKALLALREQPDDPRITEALLKEMEQGEYSTAYLAAFQLGERRMEEAIPALMVQLGSGDVFLRSECMVALVRMRYEPAYPKITRIFKKTSNPRLVIHGGEALRRIASPRALRALIGKAESIHGKLPYKVSEEIITYIAELLGLGNHFYNFTKNMNISPEEEKLELLTDMLSHLAPTEPPAELISAIITYYTGKESNAEIVEYVRSKLPVSGNPQLIAIRNFLKDKSELSNDMLLFCFLGACRVHGLI